MLSSGWVLVYVCRHIYVLVKNSSIFGCVCLFFFTLSFFRFQSFSYRFDLSIACVPYPLLVVEVAEVLDDVDEAIYSVDGSVIVKGDCAIQYTLEGAVTVEGDCAIFTCRGLARSSPGRTDRTV
jgi:hypothetical protein